jgi:hypothetical protein
MLEDMIIEGDPYFLQKYRSVHNHELDTNMSVNHGLVKDKDVNRKGASVLLPQSLVAVQEHCA